MLENMLLDELLRLFPARRTVLIALDGPGPEAKLLEQRKRRIDKVLKAARDLEAAIPGSAEALRRDEGLGPLLQGWLSETACAVLERDLAALERVLRARGLRLQDEGG